MIVERETRFAHTVLHETKDEIVEVFKTVLPRLGKTAKIIKSDCAAEYNTPQLVKLLKEHRVIEFRHSNEHDKRQMEWWKNSETLSDEDCEQRCCKVGCHLHFEGQQSYW